MGRGRDRLVGYCSRVIGGLVACAVAAATLHADVAAAAILGAVMLAVVGITTIMLLAGEL
jgi:hypothetical protein